LRTGAEENIIAKTKEITGSWRSYIRRAFLV
jgi:hypothetical protein